MAVGRCNAGYARAALLAGLAATFVLACSRHEFVTAPGPPVDEIPALQAALVASGFASPELFPAGTVTLSAPGPPGDARAYAFQRVEHVRDTVWQWTLSEPDARGRPLRAEGSLCFYVKSDF